MITIKITTFELVDEDEWKAVTTHLLHADTREDALNVVKAHRKFDEFFDSSFAGNFKGMLLKNSEPEFIED